MATIFAGNCWRSWFCRESFRTFYFARPAADDALSGCAFLGVYLSLLYFPVQPGPTGDRTGRGRDTAVEAWNSSSELSSVGHFDGAIEFESGYS